MNHRTVDSSLYDYRHTTYPYDSNNNLTKIKVRALAASC